MKSEERPEPVNPRGSTTGAMPLPDMYEILRVNLDFVGAVNAARQIRADDRAGDTGPER